MKVNKAAIAAVAILAVAAAVFIAKGRGGADPAAALSPAERSLLASLAPDQQRQVLAAYASAKAAGKNPRFADLMPESAYSVKVAEAKRATLASYIDQSGDVVAETSVDVYPDIGGRIASLAVEIGDRVRKGDVIAQIDPSTPGSLYSLSPVHSPISGTVTAMGVKTGAKVGTSTAVATVGVLDRLQIKTLVRERDVAAIKVGQRVVATFDAYPGEKFEASVARLSPVLDPTSRSRTATVVLAGDDGRIDPGMYARLRIYTEARVGVVAVPEEAIFERYGKVYAFVAVRKGDADRAELREIAKGATVDGVVEAKGGIEAGERVVTAGRTALGDGALLRIASGLGDKK